MRSAIRLPILVGCLLLAAGLALAQGRSTDFPNYGLRSTLLNATPGTYGGAAAGFWNPAAWAAMREWEISFQWDDRNIVDKRMDNWGFDIGGGGIGFAMRRNKFQYNTTPGGPGFTGSVGRVNDYQLALGGGDGAAYWGLSWTWSKGDIDELARSGEYFAESNRDDYLTFGNIARPMRHLSIGTAASLGLHEGEYRGISDLGIRPLGSHRVTLFGDAGYGSHDSWTTMQWGAGLEVQPLDGIRIAGKVSKPFDVSNDKLYTLSLGLTLNNTGFHVVPHYDKDSERLRTGYMIRLGDQAPSLDTRPLFHRDKHVVSMSLKGRLVHQKARLADPGKYPVHDMLVLIDEAQHDPTVGAVAMNLSDFGGSPAMLWEVREKLAEFKAAGKEVYIYVDRAGMPLYGFASVADYLWMDPQGQLGLPGFVAGKTYMRGLLEKLGIGVDEWRFFTYKSAFESLSRRDMSEADKEQLLTLISDFYAEWERTVAEGRDLGRDTLRGLVDSVVVFTAEMAQAAGLVDTVGRWEDAKDFIEHHRGDKLASIGADRVEEYTFADPIWGKPPTIALVYAVGDCDMDTGIRGRYTSGVLRKLSKKEDVKAVVLRVDSPGGDALPSDLVAEQMDEVSAKKPMVVSQAMLAASGGYWISMNADRIFSTPVTITGSIGVIGGWVWNNGFSQKTGFTWDHVKVGEHADLGAGPTLPIIGLSLPQRNLTDDERAKMEKLIRGMYAGFLQKVAKGRDLREAYVDSVGQGRVWTGMRALELKLVDEIGGLDDALAYARTKSGLRVRDRHVAVEEFPPRPLFNPALLRPSLFPMQAAAALLGIEPGLAAPASDRDYELRYWQKIADRRGGGVVMVPPADLPLEESVPAASVEP